MSTGQKSRASVLGRGLTPAKTEYLAELLRLGGTDGLVPSSRLSDELGVSQAAVAKMGAQLTDQGMVERIRYRGLRLTPRGRSEGIRALRAHRLAEAFLVRVMGYGWHEAHDLADSLAGIGDERFVNQMEEKAGYPRRCPHGEPIPDRQGKIPQLEDQPLGETDVGWVGRVGRVRTREPEKLEYLAGIGLVPEAPLRVMARAPFGGPVRVDIEGREVVIGRELSQVIYVEASAAAT